MLSKKTVSLHFIIIKQTSPQQYLTDEMKLFLQIDKQIICNVNNDIPVKFPSHPYVLVNTSVLCNCDKEVESLAACQDSNSKLVMFFMVNTAFADFLDQLDNTLEALILMDKTTFEQINIFECF